ncbi:MAG: insulinase family protein [Verrucomicrobia bacterium]|nr:insulinase family protein [Verrucomicrobiota bacterium]
MYHVTRLGNGLTLATAEMPHMTSVSLGLWVAAGGRWEPPELNGVCHFIEHMVFKGTRRRSARQISQAVEGIGGYLNAYTSEENTCFYSRARQDHLDDLLDVLADMILNSRFDRLDIDRERNVIKEELAMYLDQPHVHVQELLNATLWPAQPLGRPLTGTPITLDRLQRKQLLGFMGDHYVASSTLLVATGCVSHRRFLKSAGPYAARFTSGQRPRHLPARNDQSRPCLSVSTKEVEQTQFALGVRTCSRHDERRFALRLLNTVLGENMSSRLFQVIREDRGLAYNISSAISFFDDTGDLVISAGLDTDNLSETLRLVLRELRTMTERAPTPAELRRARDYVLGQFDLSLESTESQMMWLGEQLLGYGRIVSPAAIKQRIARITPAEIRRVARDFFRRDRLNLALVSPLKRGRRLQAQLDRF